MALVKLSNALQQVNIHVTKWARMDWQWNSHTCIHLSSQPCNHLCLANLLAATKETAPGFLHLCATLHTDILSRQLMQKNWGSDLNSFASVSDPPPLHTHAQHGKRPLKHWKGTAAQTSTSWSIFEEIMKHPASINPAFSFVILILMGPILSLFKQQ